MVFLDRVLGDAAPNRLARDSVIYVRDSVIYVRDSVIYVRDSVIYSTI